MSAQGSDRNLLFGLLALQNNFITREALLAAFGTWVVSKQRALGEILREQGKLTSEQAELLRALTQQHVQQHGDDPQRSLAAVSSIGELREELRKLGDPELEATLVYVAKSGSQQERDPFATVPQVGERSRAGQRFRVLRPHAKGGLGEVYVAEDLELRREVALKEIQPKYADQIDSRSRFLREAEITGGLEHPGIVPVYGLGQYADGRPFYAMRFIRGDSLRDAIEQFHKADAAVRAPGERALELRKLLGRFIDVCEAIEYAHSRGVLHRDLKPGNIMLGRYGETLVVDWGLAKAVGRDEPAGTLNAEASLRPSSDSGSEPTVMGSAVGTPAYMSPEQAAGRLDLLGPASDVYGLGATLYHVLTGQSPMDGSDLAEVLQKVQRGDFPPARQQNPRVPAALSAICARAMALAPQDRYARPLAIVDEIEHWLADEPVSAYSEPAIQRLARWGRRHRAWTQAAAIILLAVTLVSIVAAVLVDQARRGEAAQRAIAQENEQMALSAQQAEARRALAERAANEQAQRRLAQIEKGNLLLGSIFEDLEPNSEELEGKSLRVLLGERLDLAAKELEGDAIGDKQVVAELQRSLGRSLKGLGYPDKAIILLTRARETFAAERGEDYADTLATMVNLAGAYLDAGKLDLAEPLFEKSLKLCEAKFGRDHPDSLATMLGLGATYMKAGKPKQSIPLLEEAVQLCRVKLGSENSLTLSALNDLGVAYGDEAKPKQAAALYREALQGTQAKYGPEHPRTLRQMGNFASASLDVGEIDAAIPVLQDLIRLNKNKMGPDHPDTLVSMNTLALAYTAKQDYASSISLLEETIKLYRAKLGPDHPDVLRLMFNLAANYFISGKHDEALRLYEETVKLDTAKLGTDHIDTLMAMSMLASAYRDASRFDESLPLFEKTLDRMKSNLGPTHPATLTCMGNYAQAYQRAGKLDQAATLMNAQVQLIQAKFGPTYMETLTAMHNLADVYFQANKFDQSIPLFEKVLRLKDKKYGVNHYSYLETAGVLGMNYCSAGRDLEGISLLEQTYRGSEVHASLSWAAQPLLNAYVKTGSTAAAQSFVSNEIARARKTLPSGSVDLGDKLAILAAPLVDLQAFSEAEPLLRECLEIRERAEPDAWTTSNTRSMLGASLLGQKKYEGAEPLLLAGYSGMKAQEAKIPPSSLIRLTDSLQRLVQLYDAWQKPHEAAKWRKALAEHQAALKASPPVLEPNRKP